MARSDDILKTIREIKQARQTQPGTPEAPSAAASNAPAGAGDATQLVLDALMGRPGAQVAQQPVASAPPHSGVTSQAAPPAPPTPVRVCPSSVSGSHEWVFGSQSRQHGVFCRLCGHRKS